MSQYAREHPDQEPLHEAFKGAKFPTPDPSPAPSEADLNCAEEVAYFKRLGTTIGGGGVRVNTFDADAGAKVIAARVASETAQLRADLQAAQSALAEESRQLRGSNAKFHSLVDELAAAKKLLAAREQAVLALYAAIKPDESILGHDIRCLLSHFIFTSPASVADSVLLPREVIEKVRKALEKLVGMDDRDQRGDPDYVCTEQGRIYAFTSARDAVALLAALPNGGAKL